KARRMLAAAPARIRRAVDRAVEQEAHLCRKEIVQGLTSGSPGGKRLAPLAASTLATRRARGMRGTKPLIARGDLRRSITVRRTPRGVFVGILRSARSRDGERLVDIARVHEFGKVVVYRMNDKARRVVAMMMREAGVEPAGPGSKNGIVVNKIPARPFLGPVFAKLKESAPARVFGRVVHLLAKSD
ncbi:phage virion morphogenesis protein, partial [Haliangium sp.]|uniref:phage virion morphogenesis protein n=1 Tax=Haliangium sp. TaxID=2663208 RepID=UPI003D104D67